MYHKPRNKKLYVFRRIATCTAMTLAVFIIVTFVAMFVVGYRFENGQVEQYGLMQFNTTPSGAKVYVNDKLVSGQTPNKTVLKAGSYSVVIKKDGYKTWTKAVSLTTGNLKWVNYVQLVPEDIQTKTVQELSALSNSLASPDRKSILVSEDSSQPVFKLVDISGDIVKSTVVNISTYIGAPYDDQLAASQYLPVRWDDSSKHVLIKHIYGDSNSWLVLNVQDQTASNISAVSSLMIDDLYFSGNSGKVFFALSAGSVYRVDIGSGVVVGTMLANVSKLKVYEPNILVFISDIDEATKQQIIGFYRDGEDKYSIIKSFINNDNSPVDVAISGYFNDDYIATIVGSSLEILGGKYPTSSDGDIQNMQTYYQNDGLAVGAKLSFGGNGQFLLAANKDVFFSFDMEYKEMFSRELSGSSDYVLSWLKNGCLGYVAEGNFQMMDFDGANRNEITSAMPSQAVVLAVNGKYIYSFNQENGQYHLQQSIILK